MNKKGFIFIETIIVIAVLSVGLVVLFALFRNVANEERKRLSYDNTDYLYYTYYIKGFLQEQNIRDCYYNFSEGQMFKRIGLNLSQTEPEYCQVIKEDNVVDFQRLTFKIGLEEIYLTGFDLTYLKNSNVFKTFDALLIDYIKTITMGEDVACVGDDCLVDAYRLILKFADGRFTNLKLEGEQLYYDVTVMLTNGTITQKHQTVRYLESVQFILGISASATNVTFTNCSEYTYNPENTTLTITEVSENIDCVVDVTMP